MVNGLWTLGNEPECNVNIYFTNKEIKSGRGNVFKFVKTF